MKKKQLPPDESGLYSVRLSTGDNTVGMWDGEGWRLWCDMFDPPEWDPVEHMNCSVVAWCVVQPPPVDK